MFDRGRFDRLRFDATSKTSDERYYAVAFAETMGASVANGTIYFETVFANEQMAASAALTEARFVAVACAEAVGSFARVEVEWFTSVAMREETGAAAYMAQVHYLTVAMLEEAGALASLRSTMFIEIRMAEASGARAAMTQVYYGTGLLFLGLMGATVTTRELEYVTATIDVSIPPGAILTIDADTYNMTLDGVNVLWAHDGEWLDDLSRETYSVTFQPIIGTMKAQIQCVYDERWL